jgi:hypothetical protein
MDCCSSLHGHNIRGSGRPTAVDLFKPLTWGGMDMHVQCTASATAGIKRTQLRPRPAWITVWLGGPGTGLPVRLGVTAGRFVAMGCLSWLSYWRCTPSRWSA